MFSDISSFQKFPAVEDIAFVRRFFCASPIPFCTAPPPCCELLYAADREAFLTAGRERCLLKPGDARLLLPSLGHTLRPAGQTPSCLLHISVFLSPYPASGLPVGQTFALSGTEHRILAQFLRTFQNAPSAPDPLRPLLMEQLLRLLLCRRTDEGQTAPGQCSAPETDDRIWNDLLSYLQSRLGQPLTLSQICHDNSLSRSRLEQLFHDRAGCGAIAFFTRMKVQAAKKLIRTTGMNQTQIASALGYSSVSYFSRQFKKEAKMTPSEYASFVKTYSGTPLSAIRPDAPVSPSCFSYR